MIYLCRLYKNLWYQFVRRYPLLSKLIHFQGATHFLPWLLRLWIFEIYHRSLNFFIFAVIVTKKKRDSSLCSTLWFKNLLSKQLMNEQMFSLVRMLLHEWNENICGFTQSFIFKADLGCSLFWFFFSGKRQWFFLLSFLNKAIR